jgi:FG-GAP-like repeat
MIAVFHGRGQAACAMSAVERLSEANRRHSRHSGLDQRTKLPHHPGMATPFIQTDFIYYPETAEYVGSAAITDLDRDGVPEITMIRFSFPGGVLLNVRVFEVQPDGGLIDIASTVLPDGASFTDFGRGLVIADINNDGWQDVLVADHGFDQAPFPGAQNLVLLSNGLGQLVDRSADFSLSADFTHSITVGDINGDGNSDVWFGNLGVDDPYFVTLNPDATVTRDAFPLPRDIRHFTTSQLADMNGDGVDALILGVDNAIAPQETSVVANWTGTGFSTLDLPRSAAFANAINLDTNVIDINRDGRPDIVFTQTNADPFYTGLALQVLIQTESGGYEDRTAEYFDLSDFTTISGSDNAWSGRAFFHDLDLDGDLDMVMQVQWPARDGFFIRIRGALSYRMNRLARPASNRHFWTSTTMALMKF